MPVLDTLDWLHTGWRLRRIYLDPNKCLCFGGLLICNARLHAIKDELGLFADDIDYSNKQSYTGGYCTPAISLFDITTTCPLLPLPAGLRCNCVL